MSSTVLISCTPDTVALNTPAINSGGNSHGALPCQQGSRPPASVPHQQFEGTTTTTHQPLTHARPRQNRRRNDCDLSPATWPTPLTANSGRNRGREAPPTTRITPNTNNRRRNDNDTPTTHSCKARQNRRRNDCNLWPATWPTPLTANSGRNRGREAPPTRSQSNSGSSRGVSEGCFAP